jgi:hypothetical protein
VTDYTGGRNIAEYDWCYTFVTDCTGRCEEHDGHCDCISRELHAPSDVSAWDDWDGDQVLGPALCGIGVSQTIPGMFDRMGADRCKDCCDRLGYPHGVGSPKNDQACRDMLGMPPSPSAEELKKRAK